MSRFRTLLCLAIVPALAATVVGQDWTDSINNSFNQSYQLQQQFQESCNRQNMYFQQIERQIISQNMNNPQVQQMYQSYIHNGMPYGQMTFEQFAYYYGATGGFTPQGIQHYHQTTQQINAQDANAIRDYRNYVSNLWQETMAERNATFHRQQQDVGDLLSGHSNYVNGSTGERFYLPHTSSVGQTFNTPDGRLIQVDEHGNYRIYDANGYYYQLDPMSNR